MYTQPVATCLPPAVASCTQVCYDSEECGGWAAGFVYKEIPRETSSLPHRQRPEMVCRLASGKAGKRQGKCTENSWTGAHESVNNVNKL